MDLAWISLAALLVVIVVSCTTNLNAGLLAMGLAWLLGIYVAPRFGQALSIKELMGGFPIDLFLTLVGVTLLFSQAQVNGTLERLAKGAVGICRGDLGLMPIMFFVLALGLSTIGPGHIAATALMAPLAMAMAHRVGIPPLLMAIAVAHGALAGALSPFSPSGIIADKLMQGDMGLSSFETRLFLYNLAANVLVGLGGYLVLGGWRLFGRKHVEELPTDESSTPDNWTWPHLGTLAVIVTLIVGVIYFGVHIGMAAFAGAVVLTFLRAADERKSIQAIPWSVILMVCGVTMLTALLERTGGLDRLAHLVSRVSTPQSVTGISALLSGIVSVYSSTSGVVLPTLLPMVPKLIAELGGGDLFAVCCSVVVGGHLVDSSPLSTIGALCIASAPLVDGRQRLFNQMLAWGLSMAVVGAVVCYLFFRLT